MPIVRPKINIQWWWYPQKPLKFSIASLKPSYLSMVWLYHYKGGDAGPEVPKIQALSKLSWRVVWSPLNVCNGGKAIAINAQCLHAGLNSPPDWTSWDIFWNVPFIFPFNIYLSHVVQSGGTWVNFNFREPQTLNSPVATTRFWGIISQNPANIQWNSIIPL